MATTTYGTEYVQSSDLVSNYPGTSLNVANRIDDVSLKGNGLNNQTGTTYTLALTDGGKNVTLNNASAVTLTVPTFASIAFPTGTMVGLVNKGAGTVTVGGAGVTINGNDLTLNQNQTGTILKLDTNTWSFTKTGLSGKILQVVRATDTTDRSTTSTSFVDLTGMSVTITPQVSTSAIMVVMTFYASTNASNRSLIVRIADSSNTAISGAQFGNFADTGGSLTVPGVLIAYATPGTVNATTYKGQFRTGGSNPGTVTVENASMTGQIYAIELAA